MSYFCPTCQRSVPDGRKCKHWSLQLAHAGYSCQCGREGLAPSWDHHCTDCHRDFKTMEDFLGAEHQAIHGLIEAKAV